MYAQVHKAKPAANCSTSTSAVPADPDRYNITVRQQRYVMVAAVERLNMQTDSLEVLQCTWLAMIAASTARINMGQKTAWGTEE